ncbi:MAG TPA: helix-turn-helix domain-containing protein [Myxococcales bacterium]|nr:helix-turn-helix domain-containing protein [Myxococcales bacterium]
MAIPFTAQTAEQLGEILQGFRRQRGLSQRALAERIGVAQKAISAAEVHPDRLTVRRLYQLLGALDVELSLRDRRSPAAPGTEW